MCDFCNGRKKIRINKGIAQIKERKFLVVEDQDRRFVYDLGFCPQCGKQLFYHSWERVYVTNITADKVINPDSMKGIKEYEKDPLHCLICDKGFAKGQVSEKQVGFVITESQVKHIKKYGYCDVLCITGQSPYEG